MRPLTFYKYSPPDTTLAVLSTGALRWSSPKRFNDPLEMQRVARFVPGPAESVRAYMETLVRAAAGEVRLDEQRLTARSAHLLQMFRATLAHGTTSAQVLATLPRDLEDGEALFEAKLLEFFDHDNARILCLSETPCNNAMWGNYAANATGCVLGLRSLGDSAWLEAKKVQYVNDITPLGNGIDFHLYGHTVEMLNASIEAVCYSKREEWAYEAEWRVVTWAKPGETGLYTDFGFDGDELESVTFGARVDPRTEQHVRALVRTFYHRCQLYRITVESGTTVRVPADES